jgi:hypothetical protein
MRVEEVAEDVEDPRTFAYGGGGEEAVEEGAAGV